MLALYSFPFLSRLLPSVSWDSHNVPFTRGIMENDEISSNITIYLNILHGNQDIVERQKEKPSFPIYSALPHRV